MEIPPQELNTGLETNSVASDQTTVPDHRADHCYECGVCGYIYEPALGEPKSRIPEGTAFVDLPQNWRCPVCTSKKSKFADIGLSNKPSGFAENLGYGLGVNTLTPGQKNLLIFGGLALGFIFFISFYAVD
ncbi:MAG: rubredoxin [Pseudanabaenaceae cyanobacterium bins.68]|nr:rubredoxin [Pseudanabaenaceae cyanobacterium bins.68]